jgi:putative heme-binding domain-containing protein
VPGSEDVMPLPKDFKPLSIKRNDFSFDPSTGDVRLESGGARFGNTFDDWGNRFLCNIRNPCQHVVLPYRYLARNPYLVVPSALNDCAEAGDQLPVYRTSPPEPWREFRAKRWVQEGSTLPKSELVGAGVVTSSAGITVYRGDAYSPEYRDFVFVADVAGNLFYRMKLVPDGVTFKAVQVDGNKNFCTSNDLWFRPVNFTNAPDGCLHVCDMYREVIEHPWSIPDDIHAAVDLLRGRDRGRIWRLAPRSVVPPSGGSEKAPAKAGTTKRRPPKLSTAATTELVALLDHPNAWHRETAQRLLFERQDKTAVEPLRAMVKDGKTAQGKIGALWSLETLGVFRAIPKPDENSGTAESSVDLANLLLLGGAIESSDMNVAAHAIQIADCSIGYKPDSQSVSPMVMIHLTSNRELKGSAAGSAANALGGAGKIQAVAKALVNLCATNPNDPWLRQMVLASALSAGPSICVEFAMGRDAKRGFKADANLISDLIVLVAQSEGKAGLSSIMDMADSVFGLGADVSFPAGVEAGLLRGIPKAMRRNGMTLADVVTTPAVHALWRDFATQSLRNLQSNPNANNAVSHLEFVTVLPFAETQGVISGLFAPKVEQNTQLAALEALGSYREPAVADILIESWPKLTPALRDKAITLMLSRTDRIAKLLDAIEAKRITPSQLSVAAKATLGRQKDAKLAERIAKLIRDGSSSNRKEVIGKYQAALSMTGDATRGAKVYETACMVCHKFSDKGNDVGPHLGTIKAWTAEQILTNVLDPNREVSPNFALYIVETNDGRTLSGLIASETAGNLTLKRADGGTDTVLRSEIKSLTSPGISLMPEGLEAAITPQQMADLIAFLKAD